MRATAEDEQVVQSCRHQSDHGLCHLLGNCLGRWCHRRHSFGRRIRGHDTTAKIGLKAFAVVLLGGIDSIGGAIVAGIILGMLENIAAGYLDPLLPGGGLAKVFPFIVMIIVLIFKPYGLFGLARIERI